ncbi:MAG TPA: isoprenyl transferase [Firmicutes bacterium]|nr:isoprenyl transferase [Bacillota bacterium]
MDGNGRWAKRRGLPRSAGHSAGARTFKTIARYANKIGIKYMTVYAFSTENWSRPKDEVNNILELFKQYLRDASNFKDENIKVKFIGDFNEPHLDDEILTLIADAEKNSENATGMHLNIALNYGGRQEITDAVKIVAEKVAKKEICANDITEEVIADNLYTSGQPYPDLIIRPSGEYRLSNFLIWQSAYAEFWFSDVLWPDFKPKHLDKAIEDYSMRNRRFGGI